MILWWKRRQLRSKDWKKRSKAIAGLEKIPNPLALVLLTELLKDPEYAVRMDAADQLGKIGGLGAVGGLAKALQDDSEYVRTHAASALGATRHPDAISPLVVALGDKVRVQSEAQKALQKINPEWAKSEQARSAAQTLLENLGRSDRLLGEAAATIIAEVGGARGVQCLVRFLVHEDCQVRWRAFRNLQEASGDWKTLVVPSLLGLLQDPTPWRAAEVLGYIGDSRAVKPLLDLLRRGDFRARRSAIRVLDKIDPTWRTHAEALSAIPSLLLSLKDPDTDERTAAATALREIGARAAIGPLCLALGDEDPFVQEASQSALDRIQPEWIKSEEAKEAVPGIIAKLKAKDERARKRARELLVLIADRSAIKPLLELLGDGDHTVRNTAREVLQQIDPQWRNCKEARAAAGRLAEVLEQGGSWAPAVVLAELGDRRALLPLIGALESLIGALESPFGRRPDPLGFMRTSDRHKELVIKVLGDLGDPAAIEVLMEALERGGDRLQALAAISLSKIGGPSVVQPLSSVLQRAPHPETREAIAEALGRIGDASAIEPLVSLTRDSESRVRIAAAKALGALREPRTIPCLLGLLEDKYWPVRRAAKESLQQVDPDWIRSDETVAYTSRYIQPLNQGKLEAAIALGRLGDQRAFDALILALRNPAFDQFGRPETRRVEDALETLMDGISESAIHSCTSLLNSEHSGVQDVTRRFLVKIGAPAVEPLLSLLNDQSQSIRVRTGAMEALGEIGDQRAADPLMSYIADEDVGGYAMEALVRLRDQRVIDPVLQQYVFRTPRHRGRPGIFASSCFNAELASWTSAASTFQSGYNDDGWGYISLEESNDAIIALCLSESQLTSNILSLVAEKKDTQIGFEGSSTKHEVSFQDQRDAAKRELIRRGNPPYDASAFLSSR